jgi:oxalate decarboxylase/phosphoglucose isomerase-like protein (cupin superfamily)
MRVDIITERNELVIRRTVLDPGEAMFWHSDACRRFSVVVRGDRLAIEYQDSGATEEFSVHAGLADWDEPEVRVHRAINVGTEPFEEVVTFYRDHPEQEPQPKA